MLNREMVKKTLVALKNDVYFSETEKGFNVDFNDFEGFDENWDEIFRDYDNEKGVDDFFEMMEKECINKIDDFYTTYIFNDFSVKIGFTSYDI